jgi:hypothetical protein
MFKQLAVLAGVCVLTGCVSTKNVKADLAGLQAGGVRSVATTLREKPTFMAMTAGKAAIGGLIGAAAMAASGNSIVRENEVADPATYIADQLANDLAMRLGAQKRPSSTTVTKAVKPGELATVYGEGDLLLDVQTIGWSFGYFPTDWNNYRVMYSAKLRVIDTRTRKMVAEGFCARVPEKNAEAPSHDQLLADKAARLKGELRIAADYCIDQFKANVFGV